MSLLEHPLFYGFAYMTCSYLRHMFIEKFDIQSVALTGLDHPVCMLYEDVIQVDVATILAVAATIKIGAILYFITKAMNHRRRNDITLNYFTV